MFLLDLRFVTIWKSSHDMLSYGVNTDTENILNCSEGISSSNREHGNINGSTNGSTNGFSSPPLLLFLLLLLLLSMMSVNSSTALVMGSDLEIYSMLRLCYLRKGI